MLQTHKKTAFLVSLLLLSSALLITPGVASNQITQIQVEEDHPQLQIVEAPKALPTAPVQSPVQLPVVQPVVTTNHYSLKINSIGINIPLQRTSLDKQGHLMVPNNPNQAAWYVRGPKPGESGTALITGHLDSLAGPGVFFNLKKLQAGDSIEIQKPDGTLATYKVDKLESYHQDNRFPWKQVYSTKGAASLRIITCDGEYNPKTGRYNRNLVVFATATSVQN